MNDIVLHVKRTRYWLFGMPWLILGTLVAQILSRGMSTWFEVWPTLVGIMVGWTTSILLMPFRCFDVRLSDCILTGPIRRGLRTHSTAVDLSDIDMPGSRFGGLWRSTIKLAGGRRIVLSAVFYPRSEISALCAEIKDRRSQHPVGA